MNKTKDELRADVQFLDDCLVDIDKGSEGRSLTPDEQAQWDAGIAARKAAADELAAIEAREAALLELARTRPENVLPGVPEAPQIMRQVENPYDLTDVRLGDDQALRSKALKAIERDDVMKDHHREEAERVVRSLPVNIAARVAATSAPAYRTAFIKAIAGREHLFTDAERQAVERAVTLGGTAGYAVPAPIDTTIIDTGSHSTNPFRQLSTIKKITGTYWTGVSSAGVTASWDAESAEVSDDAPTLAQPQIPTFKGAAFVPFSIESEDWAGMAEDVYRMITVAKDDLEGLAFVSGNGTTAPQGVTTALDGVSGQEIAPTTAEVFAKADVDKLIGSLQARFRKSAAFVANIVWYNAIRAFETTVNVGSLISTNPANYAGEFTLAGYPAYESSDMDAVLPDAGATADNFGLLFGDFAQGYYIVDRVGLNVELIPHLFHTSNNLPKGQRGFYAHFRTGAEVVNTKAIAMLSIPTAA